MASLEEATFQRRVFAWQGPDTEPWTGTESSSAGAGWTITRDDVVVLIEQLRNAAGAVVAFVELQVDGRRTTHRGWVDPASLKRRPGDETEDELAWRREQLANIAGEHLAGREYAEAYHALGEAIEADPTNYRLYGDRALCCARLHRNTPTKELRAAGLKDAETCVELEPTFVRGHERLATMLALSTEAGETDHKTLEAAVRRGLSVDAASVSLRRALQDLRDAGIALDATLAPTDADLADSGKAAAPKTRGAERFARGDFATAADKYKAALSWDATDPRIWANRAACFSRLRRFDEALRDAEYACRLSPSARAHYREARLGQGRAGDALEACDAGLLLDCDEKLRGDLVALRERCVVVE